MSVIRKSMLAIAFFAAALPGAAAAQGWGGGDRGGYGQDRDGRWGGGDRGDVYRRDGDDDRRGGGYDRRGGDYDRRGGDYDRRGGDYDRRGWDGDRRRQGWGGGPYGPGAGGGAPHWWHGRWWNYGAGPCWRWSQWRQNWKWVCD